MAVEGVRAEREKCIQLLEDSDERVTERTDWAQRLDGEFPMSGGCPRRAGEMHPIARRFR